MAIDTWNADSKMASRKNQNIFLKHVFKKTKQDWYVKGQIKSE